MKSLHRRQASRARKARSSKAQFEVLEGRLLLAADLMDWVPAQPVDSRVAYVSGGAHASRQMNFTPLVGRDPMDPLADTSISDKEDHDHLTDKFGNEWFVEPREPQELSSLSLSASADALLATAEETFYLHSLPNANHTIYLDFDGHTTEGTIWNAANNIPSIVSPAYDPADNGPSFTNSELTKIQNIWKRVAEDFSPFTVNVTTEDPGADALSKSGSSDEQWGVRVVVSVAWTDCGCGGFAYLNSFNWSTDTPVFVFNETEIGVSAASSHEVGHALGLRHDGLTSGTTYYNGHGSGEVGWGPIMGSGYYKNVTTWDSGQYYLANNTQNDWEIITTNNEFDFRNDDHGGSSVSATPLSVLGPNSSDPQLLDVDGFGVIELSSDVDWFDFETDAGLINLTIDSYVQETFVATPSGFERSVEPTAVGNQGSNLDILATIYDSDLEVVATSNPALGLSAAFNSLDLAAGTYYLSIEGTGYGNWSQNSPTGFDQSVSRGQYAISGTVVQNSVAPSVEGVLINDGSSSRSQITSLTVTFDTQVNYALLAGAFVLTNIDTNTLVTSLIVGAPVDVNGKSSVQLTFGSGPSVINRLGTGLLGNSLANGNYRLDVLATNVQATSGGLLMASDYTFGGQKAADPDNDDFFRLLGDANGDGVLNGIDLNAIIPVLFNPNGYRPDLDTNGDGVINGIDLNGLIPTLFGQGRL